MDRNYLRKSAIETILQILKIADTQSKKYNEIGDISATEILQRDVINKYEALYLALCETDFENLDEKEIENINITLKEIREKHKLTKDFIDSQISLRENLGDNSGAKVIENLFRYELSKLLEKKQILLEKINNVLDKELELENKLKDTIQEADQFDIIYELNPIRIEFRDLEEKLHKLENEIKPLKHKLDTRWAYEIYGTINKETLMEIYKTNFNLGE
ncbi:hypothetical protein [Cetobacterium ceti]